MSDSKLPNTFMPDLSVGNRTKMDRLASQGIGLDNIVFRDCFTKATMNVLDQFVADLMNGAGLFVLDPPVLFSDHVGVEWNLIVGELLDHALANVAAIKLSAPQPQPLPFDPGKLLRP